MAFMKLPPLDLLKEHHTFPGPYTFKAVGEANSHFEARVVAAIREELGLSADPAYQLKNSGSGKHCSVTVELHAESAEQVHKVYERVSKVPGLVIML
jgi:putative lipoic acid-binding regulatory protein